MDVINQQKLELQIFKFQVAIRHATSLGWGRVGRRNYSQTSKRNVGWAKVISSLYKNSTTTVTTSVDPSHIIRIQTAALYWIRALIHLVQHWLNSSYCPVTECWVLLMYTCYCCPWDGKVDQTLWNADGDCVWLKVPLYKTLKTNKSLYIDNYALAVQRQTIFSVVEHC